MKASPSLFSAKSFIEGYSGYNLCSSRNSVRIGMVDWEGVLSWGCP